MRRTPKGMRRLSPITCSGHKDCSQSLEQEPSAVKAAQNLDKLCILLLQTTDPPPSHKMHLSPPVPQQILNSGCPSLMIQSGFVLQRENYLYCLISDAAWCLQKCYFFLLCSFALGFKAIAENIVHFSHVEVSY